MVLNFMFTVIPDKHLKIFNFEDSTKMQCWPFVVLFKKSGLNDTYYTKRIKSWLLICLKRILIMQTEVRN